MHFKFQISTMLYLLQMLNGTKNKINFAHAKALDQTMICELTLVWGMNSGWFYTCWLFLC